MTTGSGAGQITSAEVAQITAGTVLEGSFQWGDDPALTNAQRQASLDQAAAQLQAEMTATLQSSLRYFGFIR